jgi:hypothetical protein
VTTSNSETYTQPGVLWGWYTLSSTGPFDQGVARGTEGVRKILVFMTDGANTRSPNYPTHNNDARSNAGNRTTANNLTTQTCANARASDIEIFSIAFDIDDPEIKDVVRQCASDASKFMDAQDSAQLMQAFADISAYIRNLFISH